MLGLCFEQSSDFTLLGKSQRQLLDGRFRGSPFRKTHFYHGLLDPCFGQRFGFGMKGGAGLTDDLQAFDAVFRSESKRYIVGPAVQVALPFHLDLEVDALYRRFGSRSEFTDIIGSFSSTRERANSWEFPALVRYHLPGGFARVFVSGGVAPRVASRSGVTEAYLRDFYTGAVTFQRSMYKSHDDPSVGAVVGAGMEWRAGRLRIAPEFRYTRWNNKPVASYGSQGFTIESRQNQMEILVGLIWR